MYVTRESGPMTAWLSRRRRCLCLGQPRVRLSSSLFSPLVSCLVLLSPSFLWQPNPRTLQRPTPNNSPHPKNLAQSVPFLPDLPPGLGPKIRKFNHPHLSSQSRPVSHHHLSLTTTLPTPPQGPGNQAPAQPATTSSTTVASLPGSSPPSALATSEHTDDPDREKEKDKGSLSTTLTGTHHTRVSRKGAQTASEGAHSSTAVEQPSPSKSAAKHRA